MGINAALKTDGACKGMGFEYSALRKLCKTYAYMVELVDTAGSKSAAVTSVGVRIPL